MTSGMLLRALSQSRYPSWGHRAGRRASTDQLCGTVRARGNRAKRVAALALCGRPCALQH